jgi:hypothetical protein
MAQDRVKQIRATYSRFEDQSWGIRITGAIATDLKPGWVISVTKKDGTLRDEKIGRIVSHINGVFICTVEQDSKQQEQRAHGKTDREDF